MKYRNNRYSSSMGEEDQGGLPNLDPDLSKNRERPPRSRFVKKLGRPFPDFQNFQGNSRKVEANLDSPRLLAKSRGELG